MRLFMGCAIPVSGGGADAELVEAVDPCVAPAERGYAGRGGLG